MHVHKHLQLQIPKHCVKRDFWNGNTNESKCTTPKQTIRVAMAKVMVAVGMFSHWGGGCIVIETNGRGQRRKSARKIIIRVLFNCVRKSMFQAYKFRYPKALCLGACSSTRIPFIGIERPSWNFFFFLFSLTNQKVSKSRESCTRLLPTVKNLQMSESTVF